VSVEAISWALNLAPVPADRGGQPSSACKFVLVGLANHAGPDGTGAFPSVATLVRYTGLSERTVRTCLDRLEAAGIILPCDPDIVAARIKRADRRPQGWNLNLSLVRGDLDDAAVAVPQHQLPGLGIRRATGAQPGTDGRSDGVQSPHPVTTGGEPVDNWPNGVQQLHPAPGTGCNQRADEVQRAQLRGAAVAPEPYREPSREPAAPAREAPHAAAPCWLWVTVHLPNAGAHRFDVQLITRDGRHLPAGTAVLGGTHDTWAAVIPMSLTTLAQLRFVAADGQATMVAHLNARGPWGSG
jgi:hypothetical protein